MPTYQYQCTKCDLVFEKVQSFKDEAWKECIECHAPVRKLFNNVGVVFKGSGFYKTDSRSKPSTKSEGKTESKSESKAESKPESKQEKKPEKKPETKTTKPNSKS
jgi:putative FmdB family regulatory protein